MNFIFGMQVNIEPFYKLIQSFSVCVTRHAHSTQNNFEYLCNISDVLPADNHKNVLQVDSINLGVLARHAQSIQNKFTISPQYLKENVNDEAEFCLMVNDFFKVIISF